MAKSRMDRFSNRAFIEVTMSAANTLTFEQIRFAVGTFQGVGLLLHEIHWYPDNGVIGEMAAGTDRFIMALTLRDDLTSLNPNNQGVIANWQLNGSGVNTEPVELPGYTDYTKLPGGGLLVPANPIYLGMTSSGFAAAQTGRAVLFYTFMSLSDAESIELLQTIIPGNV